MTRAVGWLKLYRSMADANDRIWNDRSPFDVRSARIDLLLMACFAPGPYTTHFGTDHLERGEVIGSLRFLAGRWKWPKRRVERFLARCQSDGFIAGHRPGHHGRVYRIANYDTYQAGADESGTPTGTIWGQVGDKVEEGKKVRSTNGAFDADSPSAHLLGFARCWAIYPHRKGSNSKQKAERAYLARVRQGIDESHLLDCTQRYRRHCEQTGKLGTEFVLQASTFFGPDRRYDDDFGGEYADEGDAEERPRIPGARDASDVRKLRAAGF